MSRNAKGQAQAARDAHPITDADLEPARRVMRDLYPALKELAADWYPLVNARSRLWAHETGYSLDQVCAVIAQFSRNNRWGRNVTDAHTALFSHGQDVKGLSRVTEHVRAILAGEPIADHLTSGSKVNNFYRALLLDPDACVIDRWMFRILGRPQGEEWYEWCARAVRQLAVENHMSCIQVQSILWIAAVVDVGLDPNGYLPTHGE